MALASHVKYLDPLLDVLVEQVIMELRSVKKRENGDESGQEQRRREDQANEIVPWAESPKARDQSTY